MPVTRSAPGTEADADIEDISGTSAKRRKMRKGTRSCWACKRRKEKCVFDQTVPAHDAVCLGCRRRGTRCVSQDSPDDLTSPPDGARQMADRLVRVENLVQHLLHQAGEDDGPTTAHRNGGNSILTPAPTETGHPSSTTMPDTPTPTTVGFNRPMAASANHYGRLPRKGGYSTLSLSHALYDALPTPKDSEIIIKASYRSFYMFNKAVTVSYKNLSCQTGPSWVDITRPDAQDHPVLIARYMLQLAQLLHQLHLKFDDPAFGDLRGLSEPPRGLMERLCETAISQVSTQDRLVGSIEGLECIMLESTFYANDGKLRLSWSAARRALHLAQLMGLHQVTKQQPRHHFLDPKSTAEPSALWVRITHRDRSLSLLLGLPLGSTDKTVVSEDLLAQDTPLGQLERLHCDIMGSLLEHKQARSRDLGLAHCLDKELQQAARVLPSKWWLTPSFSTPEKHDDSTFWGIKRLVLQMSHYNILNQIHLPFMLRASSDPAYAYSQTACVNASREILSRFIVLQHLNHIAFCCRTPDFLALMAAMTLILAHLQNHSRTDQGAAERNPMMAHQYLSDRGMIEQTQESMEELSRRSGEALSAESANLLRRLLVIEAEAADGCKERAQGVDVLQPQSDEGNDGDGVVRVSVPYFGVVRIAREGIISRETPEQQSADTRRARKDGQMVMADTTVATPMAEELPPMPVSISATRTDQPNVLIPIDTSPLDTLGYPVQPDAQLSNSFDPTVGADEWAFQGIDMAFFDSLLSGDAGDELFR